MSQGSFNQGFYQADSGEVHVIRHQPETAALAIDGVTNSVAAGPATSEFWVKANQGARAFGLRPRAVKVRWTGVAPVGFKASAVLSVVVFQTSVFNGISIGDAGTYLGSAIEVTGKRGESMFPEI